MPVYIDIESYSTENIKNGTFRYAANAEILMVAWAVDDADPDIWDAKIDKHMPPALRDILHGDDILVAHNSQFESAVFAADLVGVKIDPKRWRCSMARAYAHGLPGSLESLSTVLGLPQDKVKSKEGYDLIRLFCVPPPKNSKRGRATYKTHPQQWEKFKAYCKQDIVAAREVWKKLPEWNYKGFELDLWHLDQEINRRGLCIDMDLVNAAIRAVDRVQAVLRNRTKDITLGDVSSATQRDAMLAHILAFYGVELPDMTAPTLERRMEDPDLPIALKELLAIRLMATTSSTAKYKKIIDCVSADGRLRGTLQFDGAARTGRWSGRLFQPQNLPKSSYSQEEIELAVTALKNDCADIIYPDVMSVASNVIRSVIVAPQDRKLVISDLSNIEGRDQAWLAGETWKLKAFRNFDEGIGYDLYALAYAKAFQVSPESVMEDKKSGGIQRQVGKVMELACFAPSTQILTNNGIKSIVEVLDTDLLWDGIEWVKHAGLVARGVRPVVNVDGIEVTRDHLILTGITWRPAEELVSNGNFLCQALATGSENLPSPDTFMAKPEEYLFLKRSVLVACRRITSLFVISGKERAQDVKCVLGKWLVTIARNIMAMKTFYPILNRGDASWGGYVLASLDVTYPQVGAIPTTVGGEYESMNLGGVIRKIFLNISSLWKIGINQNWISTVSMLIKGTNQAISDSLPEKKIVTIKEQSECFKGKSKNCKRVYDIARAGPRNRFTVKTVSGFIIVHNCGYHGGVGSFVTFAELYRLDLADLVSKAWDHIPSDVLAEAKQYWEFCKPRWDEIKKKMTPDRTLGLSERVFVTCDSLKRMWRRAHPCIVQTWANIEAAAINAISNPKTTYSCGKLKMRRDGNWFRIVLPSGRALCYPHIQLNDKRKISFMGIDQYTRKWQRIQTYSGKLFENVCQAVARDVMAWNMPKIEEKGFKIITTIHDEVVCEADSNLSIEDLNKLLSTPPAWCSDMPLAAGGYEAQKYRKE